MEATEECETSIEEWKQLEESILGSVVLIHNKLFGSADLVQIVSFYTFAFCIDSKIEYAVLLGVRIFQS